MAMHKFYEALCKLAYRVGAVLLCGLIAAFPVALIMELCDCSLWKAIKGTLLLACILAVSYGFISLAVKGGEISKSEKLMRVLLVMDVSPDKLLYAFYRLNKSGKAVCLAQGERTNSDAEIESAVDENGNITDPARLAVLYHHLFKKSDTKTRCIYECECNRAAVRLHTTAGISEKQEQSVERMLSALEYSLFDVKSIGSAEQRYLSADEAYAEYGDWGKAAPCSE